MTRTLQSDTSLRVFFFSLLHVVRIERRESFRGLLRAREKRESGGRFLRAAQTHGGMAGAEDAMHAALPLWFGGLERDIYYRRTNYIHEMSCGEVGSHLYSRMCCAGRCARALRRCLHLCPSDCNRRRLWLGGADEDAVNLFDAPTHTAIQQAQRDKRVGVQKD